MGLKRLYHYIASGLKNVDKVRELDSILLSHGSECAFDWTNHIQAADKQAAGMAVQEEIDSILFSDYFVVLLPCGRGTHVELGVALALGRKVFIYDETGQAFSDEASLCGAYWHPRVFRSTGSLDNLVQLILHEMN